MLPFQTLAREAMRVRLSGSRSWTVLWAFGKTGHASRFVAGMTPKLCQRHPGVSFIHAENVRTTMVIVADEPPRSLADNAEYYTAVLVQVVRTAFDSERDRAHRRRRGTDEAAAIAQATILTRSFYFRRPSTPSSRRATFRARLWCGQTRARRRRPSWRRARSGAVEGLVDPIGDDTARRRRRRGAEYIAAPPRQRGIAGRPRAADAHTHTPTAHRAPTLRLGRRRAPTFPGGGARHGGVVAAGVVAAALAYNTNKPAQGLFRVAPVPVAVTNTTLPAPSSLDGKRSLPVQALGMNLTDYVLDDESRWVMRRYELDSRAVSQSLRPSAVVDTQPVCDADFFCPPGPCLFLEVDYQTYIHDGGHPQTLVGAPSCGPVFGRSLQNALGTAAPTPVATGTAAFTQARSSASSATAATACRG